MKLNFKFFIAVATLFILVGFMVVTFEFLKTPIFPIVIICYIGFFVAFCFKLKNYLIGDNNGY